MRKSSTRFIQLIIGISFSLFMISGCSAGMSKADRISEFQSDIMARNSPREHFQGHSFAASINYSMITTIGLNNDDDDLLYSGVTISDTTFRIDFFVDGTNDFVTGTFYNAGSGELGGDDWYIFDMTDSTGLISIP